MEVIKIRLQAQHHSMADPLDVPKYRNAAHALYTVVKEEGVGALYRGISLTALRQGMFCFSYLCCPGVWNLEFGCFGASAQSELRERKLGKLS